MYSLEMGTIYFHDVKKRKSVSSTKCFFFEGGSDTEILMNFVASSYNVLVLIFFKLISKLFE